MVQRRPSWRCPAGWRKNLRISGASRQPESGVLLGSEDDLAVGVAASEFGVGLADPRQRVDVRDRHRPFPPGPDPGQDRLPPPRRPDPPAPRRQAHGSAGVPEPDLATGQRVLPGVYLGTPRPARQLLYVTGRANAADYTAAISSVHEPVANRPAKPLKTQVGRAGLEPATGRL
jgi:hypothetical protein